MNQLYRTIIFLKSENEGHNFNRHCSFLLAICNHPHHNFCAQSTQILVENGDSVQFRKTTLKPYRSNTSGCVLTYLYFSYYLDEVVSKDGFSLEIYRF